MTLSWNKKQKLSPLLRGMRSEYNCDFYYLNCFFLIKQKANFNHMNKYAKVIIIY